MKHVGKFLKDHIEANRLNKKEVADRAGITPNYLSTIFNKQSIDCELFEKICNACGVNPALVFESDAPMSKDGGDQRALEIKMLKQLLDEKERMLQFLMAKYGTPSEQK